MALGNVQEPDHHKEKVMELDTKQSLDKVLESATVVSWTHLNAYESIESEITQPPVA